MKKWFALATLLILIILSTAAVTLADTTVVTSVEDGYSQGSDGLWYKNSVAYSRTRVYDGTVYSYNSYGQYVPYRSYTYSYVPVSINKTTIVQQLKPPAFVPGWKEKALDIAKQRDEYQSYLKTLDVLGFHGQPYGYNMQSYNIQGSHSYPMSPAIQLGSYGVQGNTTYGYTYNTLKEMYGTTDMNVLYQQSARLTAGAQSLAKEANTDFSGLVGQAGTNAARVAEILAKAQAASIALRAARADSSVRIQTSSSGTLPVPTFVPPTPGGDPGTGGASSELSIRGAKVFLENVGVPKCASCHSGKTLKGNFDILAYPNMSAEQKELVWNRIFTHDRDKMMPRDASGGPGTRLTASEKQAFVTN